MTSWDMPQRAEHTFLYCYAGFRLIDDLTQAAPLGRTTAFLDLEDANGDWQLTGIDPVITPSGVLTYPGLERHADLFGRNARRYRLRLKPELYVPWYRNDADGIEFLAPPYNDNNPVANFARVPADALLTPAPNYPFPDHVPVLRGVVVDANDVPVPDATVMQGVNIRQAVTDERGTFALALRWTQVGPAIHIDASDHRTGRVGSIDIQIPGDLGKNQKIQIQ